jgi:hypothetical protein
MTAGKLAESWCPWQVLLPSGITPGSFFEDVWWRKVGRWFPPPEGTNFLS